jgi:phage tail-like protein
MADSAPETKTVVRADPLPGFCFLVRFTDLDGTVDTYFKSVSGLRSETEVIPVRAGGANSTTFNLVGAVKWGPIVFKQGFMAGSALMKWRQSWLTPGKGMTRSNGQIIQLDTALKTKAAWNFYRGWPSKWELGEFDASKSELSIETLEICHEGLEFASSVPAA